MKLISLVHCRLQNGEVDTRYDVIIRFIYFGSVCLVGTTANSKPLPQLSRYQNWLFQDMTSTLEETPTQTC